MHNIPTYRRSLDDSMRRAMSERQHALTVIDSDHRLIHESRGFSIAVEGSLANAASAVLMASVPATTAMHWRFGTIGCADTPFDIELREGVVTSADGTPLTAYCNNRISKEAADVSLFSGPTITTPGTLLIKDTIRGTGPAGQDNAGLIDQLGAEWLFQNDKITLTITNNSGATAEYTGRFFWYEIDENYSRSL